MGVGEIGQIIGETGVGEMVVNQQNHMNEVVDNDSLISCLCCSILL